MSFRSFFWIMFVEVMLSFLVFGAVLLFIDPTISGFPGKMLFYGSIFFLVAGMCVLVLSWFREKGSTAQDLPEKLAISFREGILLGFLVVVLLGLQSMRVLVWWVALLVGIGFLFLEMVFLIKRNK